MATSVVPPRRQPTASEYRGDIILAAVVLVGAILSAALGSIAQLYGDEQSPLWYSLVYGVVLAAPLAVRRRWPNVVAIVVSVAYFAAVSLRVPETYVGNIAVFIAIYTVGAWVTDRRRALLVRAGIIVGMFAWLIIVMYREVTMNAEELEIAAGLFSPFIALMLINLFVNVLFFGGAYYFGERSWTAATQREALEGRTSELEHEREVTAAQAVALDRVRIARELHDVVAHHVSVMGVQAGAARIVVDQNSAQAKQILTGIEGSARDALHELRQLLETLRTPGGETADAGSTLGLEDIGQLAAAASEAGLATEYSIVGEPFAVPSVVAVNLYRIAQESLTNARRHAGPGATADVRVRYEPHQVEVEVFNSVRAVSSVRPGLGQIGMRERAIASGGTIELTPRPLGGFRVRATVPLTLASL